MFLHPLTEAQIFELCGAPDDNVWPGYRRLPNARVVSAASTNANKGKLLTLFPMLSDHGQSVLSSLLALNPRNRPSAGAMISHDFFHEAPRPKPTAVFPTFPSKAGQERRRKQPSPRAPSREEMPDLIASS